MFTLRLKDGVKSYRDGELYINHTAPVFNTEDAALSNRLVASGYFTLLSQYEPTPSTFLRDPSYIGGVNCKVQLHTFTADVTGVIDWYDADEELGRTEGCRVGFVIEAPAELEDVTGATYTYNGQTGLVAEDHAEDPRRLYWCPLVEQDTTQQEITVDWQPGGERPAETFVVSFKDITLAPKPQTEKEKLLVELDGKTVPQLKQYAEEHGIDLGSATSKKDIHDAIVAAKFPEEEE